VLILFDDGTATIIDWKTGRQKQEHPDHNLQFKAYACGVWMQNPALKSIEIIAAYPRLKVVERSTFTYPDFLSSMEKLAEISWKAQNYVGLLKPNESCGRCGRASECPP
jgi:RecB family exonuclease